MWLCERFDRAWQAGASKAALVQGCCGKGRDRGCETLPPRSASAKPKRRYRGKAHQAKSAPDTSAAVRAAPTARMVAYAEKLAKMKKLPLPPSYAQDFQACRRFLDQYG